MKRGHIEVEKEITPEESKLIAKDVMNKLASYFSYPIKYFLESMEIMQITEGNFLSG